jgi:hypothetical protein
MRRRAILKEGGRVVRNWSLSILVVTALAAGACSRSDQRDARSQIHDAGQQVKKDLRDAQREIHKDLKEADRATEKALNDVRRGIRDGMHDRKDTGREKGDSDK